MSQASRQLARLASDELAAVARATIAMAGHSNPTEWADAQRGFALAWFARVVAPIRRTVEANAERLNR